MGVYACDDAEVEQVYACDDVLVVLHGVRRPQVRLQEVEEVQLELNLFQKTTQHKAGLIIKISFS